MSVFSEKRKNWLALLFLVAAVVIVFWDLFTLQKAFLGGDHREQQYPWAKFYQTEIQQGRLPWWTTRIQCGFPLLAEGQIGAFYPINYLFFRFFPIKFAYNYGILFHYFLGALLFYFYLRRLRLSASASFFSTLIFLFGSSQGGYFYYNYICQKVVIWIPLCLLLCDRIIEKKRFLDALLLGFVFAVMIFGGYLQVAVYGIFFTILYFLLQWNASRSLESFVLFAAAGIFGVLFSLIQLLPTYELALFSTRAQLSKEVAYIGSMNPFGFVTLFYPSWDFLVGSELFVGVLGLFFLICFFQTDQGKTARTFLILGVIFILLALGEWSPLYRAIIEVSHFHSFRTPIKFLFFAAFALCVLVAYGFDWFFKVRDWKKKAKPFILFGFLIMGALAIPPLIEISMRAARPTVLPKLENYVVKKYHGQTGHPHDEWTYRQKTKDFYQGVLDGVSILKSRDTRIEWFILLGALGVSFFLISVKSSSRAKAAACLFLFMELYLYGFTSVKGNYEPFNTIDNPKRNSPIVNYLKKDPTLFRITEVVSKEAANVRFPIFPSTNMIEGIDDMGAYSPLVMKSYKEFVQDWGGYLNDSFGVVPMNASSVLQHLNDLRRLNVKYLLSIQPLENSLLKERLRDNEFILYELDGVLPRAFFVPGSQAPEKFSDLPFNTSAPVSILDYEQNRSAFEVAAPSEGWLLVTDVDYPNWLASVDQQEQKIVRWAGLFRAVRLPAGKHRVDFYYSPRSFKRWGVFALGIAFLGLVFVLAKKIKESYAL